MRGNCSAFRVLFCEPAVIVRGVDCFGRKNMELPNNSTKKFLGIVEM